MSTYGFPSEAQRVVVVSSSGTYPIFNVTNVTGVAGVSAINSISGNLTIAGAGSVSVSNLANTITVSGVDAGTVNGPVSSTANGLVTYGDTSGKVLTDTAITLLSGTLTSSIPLTLQTTAGTNLGVTASSSLNLQGAYTNVKATNYIDLIVGGNVINQITAGHSQFYQDIVPSASGSNNVGNVALPFSGMSAGSFYPATRTITGTTTLDASADTNVFTHQTTPIVVSIPSTPAGKEYRVITTVASLTNTVTVSGIGCNIDGSPTKVISYSANNAASWLISDGANYWTMTNLF